MIKIKRWYNDDCTLGRLYLNEFQCFTLELPDKNNQTDISCIPEGIYKYKKRISKEKNSVVLELDDVPDRSYVQIHSGNYTSEILGCIIVGVSITYLNKDTIPDVTRSKVTLKKLLDIADNEGYIEITS